MSDLPPGFVLDNQPAALPEGFVLDRPRPVGAAMANPQNTPPAPPGSLAVPPRPVPEVARPWSELPGNILPSAGNALSNIYHTFTNPDTPANLGKLGDAILPPSANPDMAGGAEGMLSNVRAAPEMADARAARVEETAPVRNAVGTAIDQRYGSPVRLRNSIITDPAGVALDAATVATPFKGGALLDPLTAGGNALKLAGKGAEIPISHTLGLTTGAGTDAIRAAGRAGAEGGEVAKAFTDNMRGSVPITDIVNRAKSVVAGLRKDQGAAYRSGMTDISKDRTVLDFEPIDEAVGKANNIAAFTPQGGTGKVRLNPSAAETNDALSTLVNDWKTLNPKSPIFEEVPPAELTPANYHTPEGLDALKRLVGDIRDTTEPGTPSNAAADRVYNAVKDQIVAQAPAYAKVMEGYSKAEQGLKEVTGTFSLGRRALGDTGARKLTSAMRNNVNTNFGERTRLLNVLAEKDPTLPAAIAGQSLNSVAPRGVVGRGGVVALGSSILANPLHALALPAFSPRIVGEGVYLGGKFAGTVDDVANALHITPQNLRLMEQGGFQAGRNNALDASP